MKKIFIILLFVFAVLSGSILAKIYLTNKNKENNIKSEFFPTPNTKKVEISSKSVFVPYWSLEQTENNLEDYDTLIYFGVSPDREGINRNESGYLGLEKFVSFTVSRKNILLTLRMIDETINDFVLQNISSQEKIISESMEIIEQNNFDGLVLDLEISSSLNPETKGQINEFVQQFYAAAKRNYKKFYVTAYGDSIYRGRPFDLYFLGRNSDGIFIMAYDFHKSRGEPGPNFPFESELVNSKSKTKKPKYEYNFKKMISDFTEVVPREKITVIFGMFGYDWLVDEKKRPIKPAEALSFNEISKKFLEKCEFKDCVIRKDPVSGESEVNYVISANVPDEQNFYRIDYHIVWFEDRESSDIKIDYLRSQGIDKISYWASGYF